MHSSLRTPRLAGPSQPNTRLVKPIIASPTGDAHGLAGNQPSALHFSDIVRNNTPANKILMQAPGTHLSRGRCITVDVAISDVIVAHQPLFLPRVGHIVCEHSAWAWAHPALAVGEAFGSALSHTPVMQETGQEAGDNFPPSPSLSSSHSHLSLIPVPKGPVFQSFSFILSLQALSKKSFTPSIIRPFFRLSAHSPSRYSIRSPTFLSLISLHVSTVEWSLHFRLGSQAKSFFKIFLF